MTKLSPEQLVAALIDHTVRMGASDLFLLTDHNGMTADVRHLGIVRQVVHLAGDVGKKCIAHIKASAGLDPSDRRRPLDGRWIFKRDGGSPVDLRLSTLPTLYGEDIAMRLFDRDTQLFGVDGLGLTARQGSVLASMIESPSGLVLLTGPTGSGKTATLYACLRKLNDGKHKINTIEDPIEYAIDGFRQSQVNHHIGGVGFSELLRGVLRQSPDVIMIGEIRDTETAQTAVHAANSGHLVFATVHAAAAPNAPHTLRALGVLPQLLATAMRGVIAQRLVRTLCPKCRIPIDLSEAPHMFDDVRWALKDDEGKELYASRGCDDCAGAGFVGRTGVFEIMPVTVSLRHLIGENVSARDLRAKAVGEGMLDFRQAALLKLARGQTSTDEVFRLLPPEQLLEQ